MKLHYNYSLLKHNTFGIESIASEFVYIESISEAVDFFSRELTPVKKQLIMGGGSNLLFLGDFDGRIIHPVFKGIEVIGEDDNFVFVKVMAGEVWDDFVDYCVQKEYGGIENLSLIPGNCGASPVQNIGAFGVEVKDVIVLVGCIDIATGEFVEIPATDCDFGYRYSRFKYDWKGRYMVIYTVYKLTKQNHRFKVEYGNIASALYEKSLNLKNIRAAVVGLREAKLPNPAVLGNAGSFFKNPVLASSFVDGLKQQYTEMPVYDAGDGFKKIAAGWLIEHCGWKGYRDGNVGVHEKQALVLVTTGMATGAQVWKLALNIIASVEKTFGIALEPEVNVI